MAKKTAATAPAVPLKLQGKSVFLAGKFYGDDVKDLVKLEGAKIAQELTDKTDLLIIGFTGAANPQKKAAKLNAAGAAIQARFATGRRRTRSSAPFRCRTL